MKQTTDQVEQYFRNHPPQHSQPVSLRLALGCVIGAALVVLGIVLAVAG